MRSEHYQHAHADQADRMGRCRYMPSTQPGQGFACGAAGEENFDRDHDSGGQQTHAKLP